MRTSTLLVAFTGLLTTFGCAAESAVDQEPEDVAINDSAISAGNASITFTSSTATNYCAKVVATNGLSESTA
ncbi:MAG TPA: hypothetical protein VKP30_12045, partial [Polyangiaceae bacterium]|nr:hypothetical protein [Polyangiaceae bacterium]